MNGGPEELITGEIIGAPWHLTPQGIYFADNDANPHPVMKFFEFKTRSAKVVGQLDKPVWGPPNFAVSPDRRGILYTQNDGDSCDIYLVKNGHW